MIRGVVATFWDGVDAVCSIFTKRRLLIAAGIYTAVIFGGNLSFSYTHTCVRSHTEDHFNNNGDESTVTVCDFYTANGKRWTLLDPFRSLPGYLW